ncbi:MAG TPA: fatty acid desaturase [Egibacteraceae bacterium]|nr:fatty acid desaturase [Actinomycetota bacterium]HWB72174.1 fatty acid desaturase [Egibacteraceae bacterium]
MSQSPTELEAVPAPDAAAIMDRALQQERRPQIAGVRKVTAEELRFQRRMAVLFTLAPLGGVVVAMAALWGNGISRLDLGLFLGFYVFTGLGVTVGYHRLFTHRSFQVPAAVRALLAVAGSMSVQGPIIEWVASHRRHHAYADEYGDPHSPHLVEQGGMRGLWRGLWHAHMGWMFAPSGTVTSRWAPDLEREPLIAAVNRWFPALAAATFLAPPVIALAVTGSAMATASAFLWGSVVRVFLLHHVTWSINSICHFFGNQPFQSRDESTNNWPLSLLSFGESWHNNHHAFPTSARHGLLRGQLDPSWRVIRTLEQLRLARQVRLPSQRAVDRAWADRPRRLAR